MEAKQKEWIDNASYKQLLTRWRRAPAGDPIFKPGVVEYYSRQLAEKKGMEPDPVKISKEIGW